MFSGFAPKGDLKSAPSEHNVVCSRRADPRCLYGLNTQHDPGRASSLAWRAGGDDNGLLGALEPINLTFGLGDPLLTLGKGMRPIGNPIDLSHQLFDKRLRVNERHQ